MPIKKYSPWPWLAIAVAIVVVVGGMGLIAVAAAVGGGELNSQVGLVELYGEISDSAGGSLLNTSRGSRGFIEDVDDAADDSNIKAVVIRINSPGGSPAASQEMYNAVMRLRKQGKPVVCSMGDMAASGGYYVASSCNKIYADGSTLTGSIGVISEFLSVSRVLDKVGVDPETIVSGKYKDAGSPLRAMRPDERQLFQAMIQNVYNQFVNDVVAGRQEATHGKLTRQAVLKLADGRVYTGLQAKANLLVDAIGGMHEAVAEAGRLGNIKGTPHVHRVHGGGLGSLFDTEFHGAAMESASALGSAAGQAFAVELKQQMKEEATSTTPQLRE